MSREDDIRARLNGIAPLPWRVHGVDDTVVVAADRSEVAAVDGDYNQPDTWPIMEANSRLIANAPTDIAYLLAELDAARAEIVRLEAERSADAWSRERGGWP